MSLRVLASIVLVCSAIGFSLLVLLDLLFSGKSGGPPLRIALGEPASPVALLV